MIRVSIEPIYLVAVERKALGDGDGRCSVHCYIADGLSKFSYLKVQFMISTKVSAVIRDSCWARHHHPFAGTNIADSKIATLLTPDVTRCRRLLNPGLLAVSRRDR